MFKAMPQVLSYLSVPSKMYIGFGGLIAILLLASSLTLFRLNSVTDATDEVLNKYQPAMFLTLQLSTKMKDSLSALAYYMLSKEYKDLKLYEISNDDAYNIINKLKNHPLYKNNTELAEHIRKFEFEYNLLFEVQTEMLDITIEGTKNYPGLVYAGENLQPLATIALQNINLFINSEFEEHSEQPRIKLLQRANDMRTRWVQTMNEIRGFLSTRLPHSLSQANDQLDLFEENIQYFHQNEQLTFEQEEAIENMDGLATRYKKNMLNLQAIHTSDKWREDAYLYRTRARTHISTLNELINQLLAIIVNDANVQAEELSNRTTGSTSSIIGMLFIAMVAVVLLANLLYRGIIRPMSRAVDLGMSTIDQAMSSISDEKIISHKLSQGDEISKVTTTFKIMSHTLNDAILSQQKTTQHLRSQVDKILDVVNSATRGDLTGRLDDFVGKDAVDELGRGVQTMVDSLNSLVSQVQYSGIDVTSSATEIAATAKEQEANVNTQATSINEIMDTANQISSTSRELAETMDEVADVSEQTAKAAVEGQDALVSMEKTMHQMSAATVTIANKLSVLNEKADNINTVITTITKVADQTNLLSLNAAIEAEKAGEYGLGFAVVATEIRRLADQTAVATWDIEQMVKEMQSAVTSGVMGMDKFTEEVSHGVDEVAQIGQQLAHIISQVQTLTPNFEAVNQGMQSQSHSAVQISEGMVQLNSSAQQTVDSLRQSTASINALRNAAHELQQGVSRFKVS